MTPASALRLILLSALWGGSFPLMRVAVPALGPVWLIALRVALAAAFLWVVARVLGQPRLERRHLRHHLTLGLINSAVPFVLFAFAAQTATASTLAVLNATAPIWGALIGIWWHGMPWRASQLIGLLMGVVGVAWLVGVQSSILSAIPAGVPSLGVPGAEMLGLLAAVAAPVCYGISANYVRRAPDVPAFSNAHGSMWAATLWLLPLAAFTALPPSAAPAAAEASRGVVIAGAVLMLGIACSGVAYLLHFRLVADLGPAPALSVTFLIPVFGIFWGALFLSEAVDRHTVIGTAIILCGTALVTGFSWRSLRSVRVR